MTARILHVSDLHLGSGEPPGRGELESLVAAVGPDLLVATGDLTNTNTLRSKQPNLFSLCKR